MPLSLCSAILQEIAPNHLRAFVGSVYFICNSTVGIAIAPTLVGAITDHVFGDPLYVGFSISLVLSTFLALACLFETLSFAGYQDCSASPPPAGNRASGRPTWPANHVRRIFAVDEKTCDVLVIGTGGAGLTAAVTAKKGGLDVIVTEKERHFGGTTATSGKAVDPRQSPLDRNPAAHRLHR